MRKKPDGIAQEVWDACALVDSETVDFGTGIQAIFNGYYMSWRREAVESERERIIALLEAQDYADGKAAHNDNPSGVCRICRAIALIKGETE